VAVSGGADSLCLAYLAKAWGDPLALVVDHGLRPESASEARITGQRLTGMGIPWRLLTLTDLQLGPALAARARAARYEAMTRAMLDEGLLDLLLGHHLRDQAETVLMRTASRSGAAGLAAMAAVTETASIRLVRPLLGVAPERLRATLSAAGIGWIEDPSNRDERSLRPRLRASLMQEPDPAEGIARLAGEAAGYAIARGETETGIATMLAGTVAIYPEGYALIGGERVDPGVLAALIRGLSGNPYPPPSHGVARLAAAGQGVLFGMRLMAAGRQGPFWRLAREAAAIGPPVPAVTGAVWDRRFRLTVAEGMPGGATLGAVGDDTARLRRYSVLPAAVLRTLPAVRNPNGALVCVPHIGYPEGYGSRVAVSFCPPAPVCGAPFGAEFARGCGTAA
jgi:tRNA(Ile)-lysidine synthase